VLLGLLLGVGALYGQQLIDYSLWVDPLMFTFTAVAGMIALAPDLFGRRRESNGEKRLPGKPESYTQVATA
jgi:hypothetical protein